MAVTDDIMKEGSVSPVLLNSLMPPESDVVSLEDIAWADSCMIKDSEASESDWNSLNDAFLDILSIQPQHYDSVPSESYGYPGVIDGEISTSGEDVQKAGYSGGTGEDYDSGDEEEMDAHNSKYELVSGTLKGKTKKKSTLENPFRPNYVDDTTAFENVNLALDLSLPAEELESSSVAIFRVWDLGVSNEEDEFTMQLNKALAESSSLPIKSASDDSSEWRGLINLSVDDLVAGITDLSLDQPSK